MAQSPVDDPGALFQEGRAAYERKDCQLALDKFNRSFALSHRPGLVYNVARALDCLQRLDEAAEAYRTYLRIQPDDPERAVIEAQIRAVDEVRRRRTAPDGRTEPPLGPASVVREGSADHQRRLGHSLKIAGLTLGVVGVVAMSAGAATEGLAAQASSDLTAANHNGQSFDRSRYSTGQSEDRAGIALLAIGGAMTIVGIVVGIVGVRKARAARFALVPWLNGRRSSELRP
jgi:tetratricopeptide (TPR) repeat protein